MPKRIKKCYACGVEATTKEHAPPYGFFPKGYRENLITVPSCEKHNNDNSDDVEYVRNVISMHYLTNESARELSKGKVKRSFEYNPVLKSKTFQNLRPILLNGEQTGVFNVDISRVERIMSALAAAIYFKQFQKPFAGSWVIFNNSAISDENLEGKPDGFEDLRELVAKIHLHLIELEMPQPEIFRCFLLKKNDFEIVYKFLFFGGFSVFATSVPFYFNPLQNNDKVFTQLL